MARRGPHGDAGETARRHYIAEPERQTHLRLVAGGVGG